jgi:outer membrane protein OmpA-like peptidoglycan-associated protein
MGGIKYRNFKIAGGKKNDELNAIITKNKLVSHAINFDLGKSVIKQESMPFVMELAQVLKTNPSIKLEIDGHTDSDGNAAINLKLSKSRADEVKKQLGLLGIDTARLTTKGYGATKPLKRDTTPEGKAENRRVEFIKR